MNTQAEQTPGPETTQKPRSTRRALLIWAAVLAGIVLLLLFRNRMEPQGEVLTQFQFEQLVAADQIKHATIHYGPQDSALNEIVGTYYKANEKGARLEVAFRTKVRLTGALERQLLSRPEFEPYEANRLLVSVAVSILPFVIIAVLIWFFFIRQIRKAARVSLSPAETQARTAQQQDRFDRILTKWEEQTRRLDAVLDRMERDRRPGQ